MKFTQASLSFLPLWVSRREAFRIRAFKALIASPEAAADFTYASHDEDDEREGESAPQSMEFLSFLGLTLHRGECP